MWAFEPAIGVGVRANILAAAHVPSQDWHQQPRQPNYVAGFRGSFVSAGSGNRTASKQVSVRLVPAEGSHAGSCYDVRESHKHLCANIDACPFDLWSFYV